MRLEKETICEKKEEVRNLAHYLDELAGGWMAEATVLAPVLLLLDLVLPQSCSDAHPHGVEHVQ